MSMYVFFRRKNASEWRKKRVNEIKKSIKEIKVAFLNLGCKVNAYETEAMQQQFQKAGATLVGFQDIADVYIVNTCSVTNIADRKSRQMLHRAKHKNPEAVVVAVGCYVQTAGDELLKEEGIDLAVGNNKKSELLALVENFLQERVKNRVITDINRTAVYEEMLLETVMEKTRAYIKIEDGCNQFCSYCIIPYARGRVRSRKEEDVIDEVKRLAANGYQEIVVTGIHLSSYGMEQKENQERASEFDEKIGKTSAAPLLALLKKLQDIEGIKRIRLGSLEPRVMTEAFVKELSELSKICPHFHLSLQSGCDATLKRMNRKYNTAEYKEAVERIRTFFKQPAITTDVIVGFPGETEEEFAQTKQFLSEIHFSKMHIFKYSRRKGTVADRMKEQVPDQIKAVRSDRLLALDEEEEAAYMKQFIGQEEAVLFEEKVVLDSKIYYIGHTERYVRVAVLVREDDENLTNQIHFVQITDFLQKDLLIGKISIEFLPKLY